MRLDQKAPWTKLRRLRTRLRGRTRQLLLRMPGGSALIAARRRRAIESGSLGALVPVESLSQYFRGAIRDLASGVESEFRYFEAGVFCGQSLAVWFDVCASEGVETRAYGADSFQGLPPQVRNDEGSWEEAMFWCPREVAEWNLERLGVPMERLELIEGWYDETLTPSLAERIGRVDVAMLDADAYSSTVPVLSFLTPVLNSPSVVVFDD